MTPHQFRQVMAMLWVIVALVVSHLYLTLLACFMALVWLCAPMFRS